MSQLYHPTKIKDLILANHVKCPHCETPFTKNDYRSYAHLNGLNIWERSEKQWVYFHCSNCELDTSLAKIGTEIFLRNTAKIR